MAEDSGLQGRTARQVPGISSASIITAATCALLASRSSAEPDSLGSGAVDLTLWPSGERSLGLGDNLGFIQLEAVSPVALCLIIMVWSALFRPLHEELSLLTPYTNSIIITCSRSPSSSHSNAHILELVRGGHEILLE